MEKRTRQKPKDGLNLLGLNESNLFLHLEGTLHVVLHRSHQRPHVHDQGRLCGGMEGWRERGGEDQTDQTYINGLRIYKVST